MAEVAGKLGLVNAWPLQGDPDYGLAATDVEGLTGSATRSFFYIANDADGGDPFTDGAGRQRGLEVAAVRAGRQRHRLARRHLDVRRPDLDDAVHRRASSTALAS